MLFRKTMCTFRQVKRYKSFRQKTMQTTYTKRFRYLRALSHCQFWKKKKKYLVVYYHLAKIWVKSYVTQIAIVNIVAWLNDWTCLSTVRSVPCYFFCDPSFHSRSSLLEHWLKRWWPQESKTFNAFWNTHCCKLIPNWTQNRMIT